MKKRLAALVIALSLTAGMITGCSKLDENDVIIEMGDQKITADVANFYARYEQSQYETYYASFMGGDDMWNNEMEEGKDYEATIKEGLLKTLETLYLLDAHKADYKVELTEEDKTKIKEAAKSFDEANDDKVKTTISGNAATVEKVLELLTIQDLMYDAMTADVDTNVSDEEAAQKKMEYVKFDLKKTDDEGQSTDLTDEEKTALKTEAEEFAKAAKAEKDFKKFAEGKKYEPLEATFDKEATSPDEALVKAADALKKDEVTGVVEGNGAYFVAKVVSMQDKDATETKKESIVKERKDKAYQEICDKWIKEAKPEVNKSAWNKISFKKQGVTIKQEEQKEETPKTDDADKDAPAEGDNQESDTPAEDDNADDAKE